MTELQPLREAELSGVQAVLTDLDGTLTAGRVRRSTVASARDVRRQRRGR
jgi:hypothetical protein